MRRLRVLAFVLALLASACQGGTSTRPAPTERGLPAADAKFFSGDYDGAETDYKALVAAGTPGAPSHYSLLLDHTNRFQAALAMAGAAAGSDSFSLGRLTRAQDWAEEVAAAVETGARAVSAKPVDASARAFYAEALADAGQFDLARQQLVAAQAAARDGYAVAEVERDWANYFRSRGNHLEELNHLQLSARAQPKFPERQLELARFNFANNRATAGRDLIVKIEKDHPNDYLVLTAAADSVFVHGDAPTATRLYDEALKVRPNGPAATLGMAEIEVAVARDFTSAHDRLLASLKANPDAPDVHLYLRHLDLLVLKVDPDKELGAIVSGVPASLAAARKSAAAAVNGYRKTAQVDAVADDPALADGALAHAYYFLFNVGQTSLQGVGVHSESPSLPGYSGSNSTLRGQHFGFRGDRSAEDISHTFTAAAAVQHWVDTVYHRLPLLDLEAVSAGYGEAQVGAISVQVLAVGLGKPGHGAAVVYPAPDQSGVSSLFVGGEVPEPLPATAHYPVGYPITIQLGGAVELQITAASFLDKDRKDLPYFAIEPGRSDLRPNEFALVPRDPLKPGRYTVELVGLVGGERIQAAWQFTVAGP